MRRTIMLTLSLLAVAGACTWGTRVISQPFAKTPAGANAAYQVRGAPTASFGELFAVDSNTMLIHSDRLRRIPWARMTYVNFPTLGSKFDLRSGQRPDSAKLARLGRVSRFPQGLSGPILAQVLLAIKQDAVEDVP